MQRKPGLTGRSAAWPTDVGRQLWAASTVQSGAIFEGSVRFTLNKAL
jgi:hypothetical protein